MYLSDNNFMEWCTKNIFQSKRIYIHVFLLITFILLQSCQEGNNYKKYYPTGELLMVGDTINGMPQGKMVEYYKSGNIKAVYFYNNNNKIDGEMHIYYEAGQKSQIQHYKNGVLHGIIQDFYPDGKIRIETYMIQGKESGKRKKYFMNGNIMEELTFKEDKLNGIARKYDSTGFMRHMHRYKNDTLVEVRDYDEKGRIID